MPTRHDLLVELGLAPVWRRRAGVEFPGAGEPGAAESPAPAESGNLGTVAGPVAPPPASSAREPRAAWAPQAPAEVCAGSGATADADPRLLRIAELDWGDLAADVDACTACGLARTRRCAVPGVGDRAAEWLFVGEAPGAEEDERGEPFVGQAGKLLDAMLAALSLARGRNVYIANVLKCRPPGNRTPEPAEVEACQPYLDRQIDLIRPKLIVALGRSAANTMLANDATIASLRGRVHRYRGVPLIVTYHPAYLLRNLPDKAKAWDDLLLARRTAAAG